MYNTAAYSAASATSPLASATIPRRDPTDSDVQIEILFCGICHSDVHQVRNEWSSVMPTVYPIVPGHEIVGRVTRIGAAVSKFKPGDLAAVGCLVDSDGICPECEAGLEQFCPKLTLTYNGPDKHLGGVTYGGYSESIVVDERFVLRVPSHLDPAGTAPLLCAGITTYSPMRHWGVTGHESRRGWSRRTGPHGREARPCVRRSRRRLHHLARQGGRRPPPRR
jgi:alcohol dehydrogenase (NADP+)